MNEAVLIRNGMLMDGTGRPAVRADVLVRGDRIEEVGLFPEAQASRVIQANGLVVAPGFIDVHTHLDFLLPAPKHARVMERWARQGVSTVVAGNCGWSPAPTSPAAQEFTKTYWNFALPREGLEFEWSTMAEFLDHLERVGQAFNVAILTGHNVLRANAMGFEGRFAGADEIGAMKRMLAESLEAGSFGLSLGLMYFPGCYSHTDEIADLASVLTEFGAPLVPHTRGLTDIYDKAVEEVIGVAQKNRIPLHLSHYFCGFSTGEIPDPGSLKTRALWRFAQLLGERFFLRNLLRTMPALGRAREAIRRARDGGLEIGLDHIPWMGAFTTALAVLPPWMLAGGLDRLFERLADPAERNRASHEMKTVVPRWPNWEHGWWTDNVLGPSFHICGFKREQNLRYENMQLRHIARDRKTDLHETLFDLLLEEGGKIFFVYSFGDSPLGDWIGAHAIADPHCSIMTDVVGVDYDTAPNPVPYGTFPKVLGQFARDKGYLTQEEAVRKMTSLPAAQMQIQDRGVLRRGAFADITIFDPATVRSRATFSDPQQYPEGIEYLLINGKTVLENGRYDAQAHAGKVLRRT